MASRRIGKMRISWELLKQAMHMPEETEILDCDFNVRYLTLTVEHDDLDEVPDYEYEIPYYDPIVGREVEEHVTKYTWNWR